MTNAWGSALDGSEDTNWEQAIYASNPNIYAPEPTYTSEATAVADNPSDYLGGGISIDLPAPETIDPYSDAVAAPGYGDTYEDGSGPVLPEVYGPPAPEEPIFEIPEYTPPPLAGSLEMAGMQGPPAPSIQYNPLMALDTSQVEDVRTQPYQFNQAEQAVLDNMGVLRLADGTEVDPSLLAYFGWGARENPLFSTAEAALPEYTGSYKTGESERPYNLDNILQDLRDAVPERAPLAQATSRGFAGNADPIYRIAAYEPDPNLASRLAPYVGDLPLEDGDLLLRMYQGDIAEGKSPNQAFQVFVENYGRLKQNEGGEDRGALGNLWENVKDFPRALFTGENLEGINTPVVGGPVGGGGMAGGFGGPGIYEALQNAGLDLPTGTTGSALSQLLNPYNYLGGAGSAGVRNLIAGSAAANVLAPYGAEVGRGLAEDIGAGDLVQEGAGLVGGLLAGGLGFGVGGGINSAVDRATGVARPRTPNIANIVEEGATPPLADPVLDSVKAKFLTAAQQETNMRRTGAVGREIRQGRAAQAEGVMGAIDNGGTLEDVASAARAGMYQGGTLRKTTLLQPVQLTSDEQSALVTELGRLAKDPDGISPFEFYRFVDPEDGIIAKLQSDTPKLMPSEIKLIRQAFGDELADAVAQRSARSLEPQMTRAQELKEMERAARIEAQQVEKAQRLATREEQQLNRRIVRMQEQADQRDLNAIRRQQEQAERARIRADQLEIAQTRRYNEQALARQERSVAREALKADRDETRAIEQGLAKQAPSADMVLQKAQGLVGDIMAGASYAPVGAKADNALEILRRHLEGNQAILDGLKDAEGWRQYVGAIRATVTGELADSYLTGLMYRNHQLGSALVNAGMDPAVARKVADAAQEFELRRRFPQGIPQRVTDELATMKGAPYNESLKGLELAVQRWKNTAFGADAGVFGVQGMAAIKRGGLPAVAGLVNRTLAMLHLPHIQTHMADDLLSKRIRNILDGVHYGTGSAGVEPDAGTLLSYLGPRAKIADRALSDALDRAATFQFDNVLGWVGDNVYEGNLVMLRLLGRDIDNPAVRATAADVANGVRSFANAALRSKRSGIERTLLTSAPMTRAGVSNILQMAKFLNPTATAEERILASGLIASQAIYMLVMGKFINDMYGITEFQMDPSQQGFGQITLDSKDPQGRNRVLDLFPQASVDKAVARSFRAIAEGEEDEALDAWLRYFSGRSSPVGRVLLGTAGVGYRVGDGGGFTRDLPVKDRLLNLAPIPPIFQSVYEQTKANAPDAIGSALTFIGQSNFPESQYGGEDRYARDLYKADYDSLRLDQKAEVHARMAADGVEIKDWRRTQPFTDASEYAWDLLKADNPEIARFDTRADYKAWFEKTAKENGLDQWEADKEYQNKVKSFKDVSGQTQDDITKALKRKVITADPDMIDYLSPSETSAEIEKLAKELRTAR